MKWKKDKKGRIVSELLHHNKVQSAIFTSPTETKRREEFMAKHWTRVAAMKCMDGRVNLSLLTGFPPGILEPFRNLGGIFDLGGHFSDLLQEWVNHTMISGGDCLIFVTYHWSEGEPHRGCKGFDYCVTNARTHTQKNCMLLREMYKLYGNEVYPIQIGIETDTDSFLLHGGKNGEKTLDLLKETHLSEIVLCGKLEELYPDMKQGMMETLLALCMGNVKHIIACKKIGRTVKNLVHMEDTLGVGRGFDWIHEYNKILIVGPYDFLLNRAITTAGRILLDNLKRQKKQQGFALITSALYTEGDMSPNGIRNAHVSKTRAVLKSRALAKVSLEVLKAEVPEIMDMLEVCPGIVCEETRLFTPISLQ